jgi:hypothetical protein
MLRVSIGSKRKCFPRIVSVLILKISVRKGGCPSKLPYALFQEVARNLHDPKISYQGGASFILYSMVSIDLHCPIGIQAVHPVVHDHVQDEQVMPLPHGPAGVFPTSRKVVLRTALAPDRAYRR